jgi:hypothetical protein
MPIHIRPYPATVTVNYPGSIVGGKSRENFTGKYIAAVYRFIPEYSVIEKINSNPVGDTKERSFQV